MALGLDLVVEGKIMAKFSFWYSRHAEAKVLEAIFPKEHWSDWNEHVNDWYLEPKDLNTPPAFDFVVNEEKVKEVMREYHDSIRFTDDSGQEYIAAGAKPEFEEEFWRAYRLGISLQREGKVPRVCIG